MERGHIKLWRKSFDSGIIQNANLWTFWTWCLLKASWKKRNVIINFQHVEIEPGQFIFGRKVASFELKMSEQVIRTCLKSLKKMENVTIKTTNKYSIISIVNWDSYQGQQPTTNQQANQQLTSNQPASNQQVTTDKKERKKEVKESKELKNTPNPSKGKRFVEPNFQDVSEYCLFRKNNVDPNTFIDFYESKGWMVGKNKMKDWKAAVRTWEKSNKNPIIGKRQNNFNALVDQKFEEIKKENGYL